MIKIRFTHSDGNLVAFSLSGHSGYAQQGEDIVCAAVSSAAYMTANTLTEILALQPDISLSDGKMTVELSSVEAVRAQDILRGFSLHMEELSKQYPDNITYIITEV